MTDAFTVLFFVSVGMLLDPAIAATEGPTILAILAVVVVGKAIAALGIVALRRAPLSTGLVVSAGLAQVGEFSFIVATAGLELGLLPQSAFQVVVAVSIASIAVNPLLFSAIGPAERWIEGRPRLARLLGAERAMMTPR
jgi:CPA2 family monovalent cation:H+ antiporter-2